MDGDKDHQRPERVKMSGGNRRQQKNGQKKKGKGKTDVGERRA
jgi:hypothetical protein